MTNIVNNIVQTVQDVLGDTPRPVPLHIPVFQGNEWGYVKECIDTGWVSSVGSYVDKFEQDMAKFTGAGYAVAVVNGTAALHIALQLAGVERGHEVLCPSLTFVATANAIAYCGATPHFVDVEPVTMGIDAAKLDAYLQEISDQRDDGCYNRTTGRPMRVLLPMHTFGHPCDMYALMDVAKKHRLTIVEDAAESLGSYYRDQHTGRFGRLGILSFNGNKIITTGGGGMIITDDEQLAKQAKHITTTAKLPHRWEYVHDQVGYNYRMPNLNAAMGCAQLEQLPGFIAAKRRLAMRYQQAFASLDGVTIHPDPPHSQSNYWLIALVLESQYANARDELLAALCDAQLFCRPIWQPMHQLSMYADCPRMAMDVTESLAARVINVPSSAHL